MSPKSPECIIDPGQQAQQPSPLDSESDKGVIVNPLRISDQAWEALARAQEIAQKPQTIPVPAVYDGGRESLRDLQT